MDQVEPVIVAVVQQSLEFAVCYLENSDIEREDFGLQVHGLFSLVLLVVVTLTSLSIWGTFQDTKPIQNEKLYIHPDMKFK